MSATSHTARVLLVLLCEVVFSFSPHSFAPTRNCLRRRCQQAMIPSTTTWLGDSRSCQPAIVAPSYSTRLLDPRSLLLMSDATSDDGHNEVRDDDTGLLQASVAVGAVAAALGYLYGKVLSTSVKALWTCFPAALSRKSVAMINPIYFITGTCTVGGLLVGVLSSKFHSTFTVADFVSAFSTVPAESDSLPKSRVSLLPLLLLSLITSTFAFSVGPEAPMVCAGGLIGVSLSRKWFGKDDTSMAEYLGYAGAAGALTAFMGIPIAGSIFALELTRASAGMSSGAREALSPAVAASIAALVLLRAVLLPHKDVGGHFAYGTVGAISGRSMMTAALAAGVGGAVLGTVFHKSVTALKGFLWPSATKNDGDNAWKREVLVKTTIGVLVGLLSTYYPQTMFWGEGSLQCVIDGQQTAFASTTHGLSSLLTSSAKVNPNLPFGSASAALQVGVAKFAAIILAAAGKFPGGIIFPLFFAAAPFAHAFSSFVAPSVLPVLVMCLMASTQAAATRTPLATTMILSLSASATSELSVMLPACMVASYTGVWVAQFLSSKSYFKYSKTKNATE